MGVGNYRAWCILLPINLVQFSNSFARVVHYRRITLQCVYQILIHFSSLNPLPGLHVLPSETLITSGNQDSSTNSSGIEVSGTYFSCQFTVVI